MRSASTRSTGADIWRRRTSCVGERCSTVATHSSGSCHSSSSMQISRMPRAGPSRSSPTTPGIARSRRAPSSTTTISGENRRRLLTFFCRSARRSARICVSSARRRPMVSASDPTRASASCPSVGRTWGSHTVHAQSGTADCAVSTTNCTSRGDCVTASWPSSQRPIERGQVPGPAMPTTPTSASGTVTGTPRVQRGSWSRRSWSRSSSTVTVEGRSPMPTRTCRWSASVGRRSHRRRVGVVAVIRSAAASSESDRRWSRSARTAPATASSIARTRSAWSARALRWLFLPVFRAVIVCPITMIGVMNANSR